MIREWQDERGYWFKFWMDTYGPYATKHDRDVSIERCWDWIGDQ